MEIFFFVSVMAVAVGGGLLYSRWVRNSMRAQWQVAANRLKGTASTPTGSAEVTLTATLRGNKVIATQHGLGKHANTAVTAQARGASSLSIDVFREHAFSSVAKALGGQDIEVGDAAFDAAFVVRSSDEELGRAWLSRKAAREIMQADKYRFTLENGEVIARHPGVETDAATLEHALRAAAALASGGQAIMERWIRLAQELGGAMAERPEVWNPRRPAQITLDVKTAPIIIDALRSESGRWGGRSMTYTRVEGQLLAPGTVELSICHREHVDYLDISALPEVSSPLPDGYLVAASDSEQLGRVVTEELWASIERLAPAAVTLDESRLTILLTGVVTDAAPIREAIEIAAAVVAVPSRGPFR